jgi:ribosomal protein S18 acetylase RimI-like enzyme
MRYSNFNINIEGIIRSCRSEDLKKLLWFGKFYEHKEIINKAYERQSKGELIFLVAEINNFPAGQLWIDFKKSRHPGTALIWAFRVFSPFRSLGIGKRLIKCSEKILISKKFKFAEIGVEKDNRRAKSFYEKMGYIVYDEISENWNYTNPEENVIGRISTQWILRKELCPYC